ncbi:MAG: ApbE family protein [Pseudohongiellaceae bacterium]
MSTLFFTIAIFFIVLLAMSVGVMAGRKPIQGSCGGLEKAGAGSCGLCGDDTSKCGELSDSSRASLNL